jgi:hypothetical protein
LWLVGKKQVVDNLTQDAKDKHEYGQHIGPLHESDIEPTATAQRPVHCIVAVKNRAQVLDECHFQSGLKLTC